MMVQCLLIFIVASAGISVSGTATVVLTSNLVNNVALHGQNVTFTCTITSDHDTIITWKSAQYIGNGNDLQLTSDDSIGERDTNSQHPNTVATLTNNTHRNGVVKMVSELRLIASVLHPDSDVSCRANGSDPVNISFRVINVLRVTLTNNLGNGRVAYHEQGVTFICTIETGRDIIITWSSAHYIGAGGIDLQLASIDQPGSNTTNPRNPTTVATLINTTRSNNGMRIISELQLTASVLYPASNISCRANGRDSASLILRVVPRVTLTHDLGDDDVAYNTQRVTFICTIAAGHDIIITWSSDDYIGTGGIDLQLASIDQPGSNTTSPRNPTTVATLINTTRSNNGVITITSELQLIASAQYPTSSISCRANGDGPVTTVVFQTSMLSTSMTELSTTRDEMTQSDGGTNDDDETVSALSNAIGRDLNFFLIGIMVGLASFILQ